MAVTDNTYFAPILPDFSQFFGDVDKKAREGGKRAGKGFSDSVGTSLKSAERAADKFAGTYKRAQDRAADAAGKTRVAQDKLNEVLNDSSASTSKISAATERYEKAKRDESRAVEASEKASKNLADAQDQVAKATSEAGDAMAMASDEVDDLDSGFGGLEKTVGIAVAAFGAFQTVKTMLYDVGSAFDDMYDTLRVGTGASGEAFDELSESARRVADTVPAMDGGLDQIGTTMADLNTRLGVAGEPLEELTSQFVQLQNMGIEADINDVAGSFQQFGITAEQTPDALDTLFQISQATGRSITELTGNLSKSGPALQQFGFGLDESAGLLGALDKAGLDSEKTLGDMTKALGVFAKKGEDPQKALWGTISQIDELTKAGKNAEAIDLSNSIFGNRGGSGFVAAVQSGKFEYDDFMESIGASSDTILGVADETADFAEKWQLVKQQGMLAIEPLATAVFDAFVPALEFAVEKATDFGDALESVWGWVQRNQEWLGPLVATITGAATAWALWNGAIKTWQMVTKIATGIQVAFNAVMAANPIMLVVMAVAALAAGLVYFFTQTETGKEIWDTFTEALGNGWQWVVDKLSDGWTWIKDNVFTKFTDTVESVKDRFGGFVDALGDKWDGLKSLLAKPINFMINTVYNDGILSAWNTIAGILPGLETGSRLAGIREYAVGGAVRGPGTGTSDDIPAMLSNGEHVWTANEVSGAGGQGALYAMRNAVADGRGFTYDGNNLALLPNHLDNRVGDLAGAAPGLLVNAYAKGGEVRPLWEAQLMRGHDWAKSRHGRPYVLGGSSNGGGGTDCSGFMSGIANVMQGGDGARQWATMAFNGGGNQQYPSGPQGFVAGLKANTLSIGVTNGGAAGGHTAGTLGAVGAYPATNVESGGSPSLVKYGVGAAGADDGYFNTHYHLPIGPDGAFVSGGNGSVSPESMSSAIGKKLGGVIDKIMGPVVDLLPTKPPEWQGIPKGMYDKGKNGITDFVGNAVGQLGDKLASVYSAVQGMGDLVKDAAKGTWGWITDNLNVFDTGGVLKPGGMAVNKSNHPELIINHAQLGAFDRLAGVLGVSAESMQVMAKELNEAYNGGDWGYGELARVLGNEEWAKALVNGASDLGEFMRTYGDVVADVGKAVSDHFTTEAGNVLSLWGLEDLAGLEVRDEFKPGNLRAAGENLWDWYNDPNYVHPDNIKDEESTITTPSVTTSGVDAVTTTAAASTPETASTSTTEGTAVIKATSADDMVRVGDLEELNGRVVRLEVDMDKAGKVPAGATTRGGVV